MRAWPLLFAIVLLAGCLNVGGPPAPSTTTTPPATSTTPLPPGPANATLVEANTRFAVALVQELRREDPDGNLVVSPFSVSTALAMLYAGANGTTRAAMAASLGFDPKDDEAFHASYRDLLGNVTRENANRTLAIGDSLWIDQAYGPHVDPAFVRTVQSMYAGELGVRDFRSPDAARDINAWASNATRGKIPKVLDAVDPSEVLFLLNAVYFNGTWVAPFNATCTHKADFARADGSRVQVDMMCGAQKEAFRYANDADGTVVLLPYRGFDTAMYVVLPPAGQSLDAFVAGLDGAALARRLDAANERDVELQMPKLALKTHVELHDALDRLGMGVLFAGPDLSGIGPGLAVSRVLHDAVLEVDERGTVAAAVTTIGVVTSLPPPPLKLTVDRPYMLVLRDLPTGSVLFVALVADPTAQ